MATKKGAILAAKVVPLFELSIKSLSLLMEGSVQNGLEPSRARRCWARRSEPLTAPGRSDSINQEGKARSDAPKWSRQNGPSPAAFNIPDDQQGRIVKIHSAGTACNPASRGEVLASTLLFWRAPSK